MGGSRYRGRAKVSQTQHYRCVDARVNPIDQRCAPTRPAPTPVVAIPSGRALVLRTEPRQADSRPGPASIPVAGAVRRPSRFGNTRAIQVAQAHESNAASDVHAHWRRMPACQSFVIARLLRPASRWPRPGRPRFPPGDAGKRAPQIALSWRGDTLTRPRLPFHPVGPSPAAPSRAVC